MNIIEYTKNDYADLEAFKSLVWPAADREHYGANMPDFSKSEFTLIAKDGDTIVGYGTVSIDAGVAHFEPLMVATDRQGQGIGKALVKAREEKAKSLGAHKAWLETGATWKARAFHEKNGFVVRAILPNHIGHQDFVLMDKML